MFRKLFYLFLVLSGTIISESQTIKCNQRGSCICDCKWTLKTPCNKLRDDKSCCFSCCCKPVISPTISPSINPIPVPIVPVPISVNPVQTHKVYCPSIKDLVVGYGNAKLFDQGWINSGGGAAATKSAFNLLGGEVEFDIDFTNTQLGINGNIYTISPKNIPSDGFRQSVYCDGAKKEQEKWCVEIDWIESNGNCGGAVTIHTIIGPGNGCTAWGCREHFMYNGKTSYHVKMVYDNDGKMTMYRDNQVIGPNDIKPKPLDSDWKTLADAYRQYGAVIYSSLWQGWVPLDKTCASGGSLPASSFSVKNLKITGTVVQGPEPTLC